MKNKEKNEKKSATLNLIEKHLKENKDKHFDFDEEYSYKVSTGSLLLDIEMEGGICPQIIRFCGHVETGKTSLAFLIAKNFQEQVSNSMVVYFNTERRTPKELIQRSGIDTNPEKLLIHNSKVYDHIDSLMKKLVKDNPDNRRYLFIIDSMDGLVEIDEEKKTIAESSQLGGTAKLNSTFLKRMALALAKGGHTCIMISQFRSTLSVGKSYVAPKAVESSGGYALLHYSDWILEFGHIYPKSDYIWSKPNSEGERLGHWCKITFRKTVNEKTGRGIRYPIKHGQTGGKSVWTEIEVIDVLKAWDLLSKNGAWYTINNNLLNELKQKKFEIPEKFQGESNIRKYLEQNEDLTKYLFNKLRTTLIPNEI